MKKLKWTYMMKSSEILLLIKNKLQDNPDNRELVEALCFVIGQCLVYEQDKRS